MNQSKTHVVPESTKQHGDKLDPIPAPEDGGHSRSSAAHLGEVGKVGKAQANSQPAGKSQQSGTLREPPSIVERAGKQHR